MRNRFIVFILICYLPAFGQVPSTLKSAFPEGTTFHQNVPYANDTLKKHLLDVYVPANAKTGSPVVVWVHGGGWMVNDKYADMSYMKKTIGSILEKGYVLASIDYRHSTTQVFPAQIHDCSAALQYLYDNAGKYKFDREKIVLMGFSAGGHLASLLALSLNNDVKDFYPQGKKPTFKFKGVLDFYGPSNLLMFFSHDVPSMANDPISKLLGASALLRPDLATKASPATYVDKNDPPFLIVHGEKDQDVPSAQSHLLKSYLDLAGVKNELIVVKDAPHYGEVFDQDEVRLKVIEFLDSVFR